MQLNTLAAAKVFIEALTLSGNNPTRARLVTSLEQLKDFDTGYSPRVTFTKDRRIGAPGAHMITFDPETKNLVPIIHWVPAH
jgi:hypothetical protein